MTGERCPECQRRALHDVTCSRADPRWAQHLWAQHLAREVVIASWSDGGADPEETQPPETSFEASTKRAHSPIGATINATIHSDWLAHLQTVTAERDEARAAHGRHHQREGDLSHALGLATMRAEFAESLLCAMALQHGIDERGYAPCAKEWGCVFCEAAR